MKSSDILKIFIGLLLVIFVTVYFVGKQNKVPKIMLFQPEGQMLDQATLANKAVTESSGKVVKEDNPINKTPAPYLYSSSICQGGASYVCLASYYKSLVSNYGASKAVEDLKRRSGENGGVLGMCHPLVHVIGREAAQSYANVWEAFQHGDAFCWSGYYHGVLEGVVAKVSLKNLPEQLDNICKDIPGKEKYNFDYYNCVHGLGHGIMAQLRDEVFDSLTMCDNLTGFWEHQSCYSGVYMQNIIDSTNVADTDNVVKYLKPSEPLYPCTAVDTKYKSQCYLGQTSYALQVSGYDFAKVFNLCSGVEQPYRDICNQSMGRDVANQMMHDAILTRDKCAIPKDPNDVTNCVIGAVKEIISYYHSDKQALDFCSILDESNKNICVSTASAYYSYFQ